MEDYQASSKPYSTFSVDTHSHRKSVQQLPTSNLCSRDPWKWHNRWYRNSTRPYAAAATIAIFEGDHYLHWHFKSHYPFSCFPSHNFGWCGVCSTRRRCNARSRKHTIEMMHSKATKNVLPTILSRFSRDAWQRSITKIIIPLVNVPAKHTKSMTFLQPRTIEPKFGSFTAPSILDWTKVGLVLSQNMVSATQILYTNQNLQYNLPDLLKRGRPCRSKTCSSSRSNKTVSHLPRILHLRPCFFGVNSTVTETKAVDCQ